MFLGLDVTTWAIVAVGIVIAAVIFVRRVQVGLPQYAPATTQQRVVCGALFAGMLAAWAAELAGWDPFGGYTKLAVGVFWLAAGLYVIRLLAILER
jgi:hypothetical protein